MAPLGSEEGVEGHPPPHPPTQQSAAGRALDAVRAFDHRAVERFASLDQSGRLRRWMLGATRAADGWGLLVVVPVALLFGGARGFAVVGMGIVSGLALAVVVQGIKALIRRARPTGLAIEDPIGAPDRHAFPSGHTSQAFGVVVLAWWLSPWLGLLLLPVAVGVGLSRMFFGLHFPSDVVVGGVLGCLMTQATLHACVVSGLCDWLLRISPLP